VSAVAEPAIDWPRDMHAALKAADIRQVGYVPDAGHRRLIELCRADPAMRAVVLTTEEEGVALAVGAWLGGQRAALLMQSSGVGNCINMLSLLKTCGVPLLMLVTMRGEWGEFNPWQVPMGGTTQASLELADVRVHRLRDAAAAGETVAAAARLAFSTYRGVAVLIGQQLIGFKTFGQETR
jgi:sulfopyruvate decarboxylase alpha subunit